MLGHDWEVCEPGAPVAIQNVSCWNFSENENTLVIYLLCIKKQAFVIDWKNSCQVQALLGSFFHGCWDKELLFSKKLKTTKWVWA